MIEWRIAKKKTNQNTIIGKAVQYMIFHLR